jgi:hypothetical protein
MSTRPTPVRFTVKKRKATKLLAYLENIKAMHIAFTDLLIPYKERGELFDI